MKYEISTILLVEDELDIRIELKKFLQRYYEEVFTASNGEEGLTLFEKYKPQIIISDIKMPKMNGIDMIKKIKKHTPDQIVIFTTAHSDNNYFLEAIEIQVDGYILKPVDLSLLKKKIKKINKNFILESKKQEYKNVLDDIALMQDGMLAVYNIDNVPIFYNKNLLTFVGYESLEEFLENNKSLSYRFEINTDCYHYDCNISSTWVEEIKRIEPDKRIISMKQKNTQELKFFLVSISEKTLHGNCIVNFSEITTIFNKKRKYKNDAYTDELTQVNNRKKFNNTFSAVIEKFYQNQNIISLILIDIDNFKQVNDLYGHTVGDSVLQKFTTLVMHNIDTKDSFFRWGGEEFIVILKKTTSSQAKDVAERLRLIIEAYDFEISKPLTCSFGVSTIADGDTSESFFKRVDNALYKAKNDGKNKVVVML